MNPRDGYPPGVPCWLDTAQPDPSAAAEFYRGLFGWEIEDRTPAGSELKYLVGRLADGDVAAIASRPVEYGDGPATWNTYVWVESADATAEKVEEAGGTVVAPPFDAADAGRIAAFTDPAGAAFRVFEPRAGKGAQVVNEHGSWNFSGLSTPDPERARSFYGAVFGWEASDDGDSAFWRMPGYGDHLESRDPGLRERMGDVGAPQGFEDAVGWLNRVGDDEDPHWGVTFAVDDADATAERATALGGEVLAPPVDAPWVRMTVLRDPQGAVFTASKFVPPTD